jgi:hypothetical protein
MNPLAYTMRIPSVQLRSINFRLSRSYLLSGSGDWGIPCGTHGNSEADVAVPDRRVVTATIRRPAIRGQVVPTAATEHAVTPKQPVPRVGLPRRPKSEEAASSVRPGIG